MSYTGSEPKTLQERATQRMDVRAELLRLEQMIEQLKIEHEQFFLGLLPHAPDKLHREVKQKIRALLKAPFKNSQMNYTLRNLRSRYQTYNTYWTRVNRERDAGTYSRDVFKANLREKNRREAEEAGTAKGKAKSQMQSLFRTYKSALEKQTGTQQALDYEAFQRSLIKRAKAFKAEHGNSKLSFTVVVKEGKVTVQAKAKK